MSDTEYKKLSNSITEFGLVDPIIINLNNYKIIGGHKRYDVLLNEYTSTGEYEELSLIRLGDIGWVFPTTELSIRDTQHEKALNITLNKITGEWDTEKLSDLFNDLSIDGFDVSLTGFEKFELRELNVDLNNRVNSLDYDFVDDFTEDNPNETTNSNNSSSGGSGGASTSKPSRNEYKILVTFSSEKDQDKYFEIFTDEGLNCRIIE